ncbi:MAG TPA: RNA 2',3'-cyclic phosphodiesterase [Frankiaceae bacterium]|nr:RNA 2',3'-cyclic phosphodiesterase [Frankiaceae bacterium]
MRAFVAVVPPPSALAPLVRAVEPLRDLPASWVPAERLHLTLVFLGEVADPLPYGAALAEAVAGTEPFALRVAGAGAFPRPARPRVLWAGVEGEVEALAGLARVARRTARAARIDVERKPYVPHVTVARVRRRDVDGTDAVAALAAVDGAPWHVSEVVLMRSVLGPRPEYTVLRRCAF